MHVNRVVSVARDLRRGKRQSRNPMCMRMIWLRVDIARITRQDANHPYEGALSEASPNNCCALRWQIFSLSASDKPIDCSTLMVSRM